MFDHYGGKRAAPSSTSSQASLPLDDGVVLRSIHEVVNKVKSGRPVGSGKSTFTVPLRRYFEDYTVSDAGQMYTFRWTNRCDVIPDQDPSDDTVQSPMNQDLLVLLPLEQRQSVIETLNEHLDAPYSIRHDFYMIDLLAHYDDLQAVLENHVEVIRLIADENKRQTIETFEPKDK